MSLVRNERTKLLARALNTAATSCFTVGIAAPEAGYIYDVGAFRSNVGVSELLLAMVGWFAAAVCIHLAARRMLGGLNP